MARYLTAFAQAWALVWRSKERDEYLRQWVITMPHSPAKFCLNGIVARLGGFYSAFDVKAGDVLFHEPDRRVRIW